MRTEQEMLKLLINTARDEPRVRAALLVGSRANPAAPRDEYQDYDVTYLVADTAPFYNNLDWVRARFGEPAVAQLPESMALASLPPDADGHFTYLMLFPDGVRVDLSVYALPYIDGGEPAIILLDKDGCLPPLPAPTDAPWHVTPPTAQLFADCCNEFWWCLNNVAKGVARDELPYAMAMLNGPVRDMLDQMTAWHIGAARDFAVSAGKLGKYFKKYLSAELYALYAATYSDAAYEHVWAAVFTACALFRTLALELAARFGYTYNRAEDASMTAYLTRVREASAEFYAE
ncbi:MAG: aminoglycoside 6-adenylyltransferase [Oscillospiraceae bacterium]|nr:aminoglycoside 6-adenylyltransferase [Oscillospiraceae bacterium]